MLTLVRHGQAGSRISYDDLSDTGREQAHALGAWFQARDIRFDRVIAGGLYRQQKTAQEMIDGQSGVLIDPRWSEFDLDGVYAGIAPLLAEIDETFRAEYEQLQLEMHDPDSSAHRTWRGCDVTVVRAWIEGRFEFDGESFPAFAARVREALNALPRGENIAVVTSATPIALCMSFALDLVPPRVMQLAGALRNASFTELDLRTDGVRLLSFNNVPHLAEPRLHTLR